jgi:hypothetical protein
MEGTSDHRKATAFTSRRWRWSRRSPRSSEPHAFSETIRRRQRTEHARRRMTAKIEKRGDRDGGVRGLDASSAAGRKGPRSCRKPRGRRHEVSCSKQRGRSGSGVVKTPAPSVKPGDDLGSSQGVPGRESGSREPGTYGRTGNRFRSGGRSRLDASRVFRTGRSQGLVVGEGASQEEARSTA